MEAQSAITKLYRRRYLKMKKIMTAALGLSLLSGAAVFAQNTSTASTDSGSMKSTKKAKKHKKGSDTMSSTASSTTK
ncbi:MAG: hypothetical protein JO210_04595 [Acidobacteriaceae bacterium]|nr:hypothetical protein [Acidobacteriaceae bacterium]